MNATQQKIVETYGMVVLFFLNEKGKAVARGTFGKQMCTSPHSVMFEIDTMLLIDDGVTERVGMVEMHVPGENGAEGTIKKMRTSVPGEAGKDSGDSPVNLDSRDISTRKPLVVYPIHVQENRQVLNTENLRKSLQRVIRKAKPKGHGVVLRGKLPPICERCEGSEFERRPPPEYPEVPEGTLCYRCSNAKCLHYEFVKPSKD